ncbi:MAG: glycosyltransferase family 1 protein [Verrucomicrobiota bacterium]
MNGTLSDKPKVGVNTLCIYPGRNRGVQTYLDQLLLSMVESDGFRWVLFVSRSNQQHYEELLGERKQVKFVVCGISGANRVTRVLYEQTFLQRKAIREKCDLMFFPGYLGPIVKRLPIVLAVHDMQFRDIPEGLPIAFRLIYGAIVPRAIRAANVVITISEFSKSRISYHFPDSKEKITVTYLAARKRSERERPNPIQKPPSCSLPGSVSSLIEDEIPYLLSVSSANRHKNIDELVRAFAEINQSNQFRLVLVGVERSGDPEGVISTGYLTDESRDAVYDAALAYVFASRYEGFGLPLLEAMEAGLPVASSWAGSLKEVGGDACLFFDPTQRSEISDAMLRLFEDGDLRGRLVELGEKRASKFCWEKTASETLDVFQRVYQHSLAEDR